MADDHRRTLTRRRLLAGAAAAGLGLVGGLVRARPTLAGCDGACGTLTVWMLHPDWGYPRGPHGKTALRSRASRRAAAHRIARSAADAEHMNLHLCSFAPPRPVQVCEHRFLAAWSRHARPWRNPWNGRTVQLLDTRWLPASLDLWSCPTSEAPVVPVAASAGGLARTGIDLPTAALVGGAAVGVGAFMNPRPRARPGAEAMPVSAEGEADEGT